MSEHDPARQSLQQVWQDLGQRQPGRGLVVENLIIGVVSFVTVMVILYLVVNLIVDMLYAVLDPRIRYVK